MNISKIVRHIKKQIKLWEKILLINENYKTLDKDIIKFVRSTLKNNKSRLKIYENALKK